MPLVRTTLASAATTADTQIVVASATGFVAGNMIVFGQEVARVSKSYVSGVIIPLDGRGLDGTVTTAHPITEGVVVGLPSEFADANLQSLVTYAIAGRAVIVSTYSAAGAISLPPAGGDARAIINGTALAMTVAVPTLDLDGSQLTITNGTAAAHTVTFAGGLGGVGATADVVTFAAGQKGGFTVIAANATWNLVGTVAGAASVAGPGIG